MAPEPSQARGSEVPAFDGNWPALVERIGLTGMAGMAARHAELTAFANNHLELVVPEAQRMYAEKPYQDKLKAELSAHFAPGLRLTVRVGTTAGTSVAAAKSREMAERQANAAEAIQEDPFVRELIRDLGAEVVSSSIRPAEEGPGKPSSDKR
jgi:DNA polymerase-3 subunit gamma/tau